MPITHIFERFMSAAMLVGGLSIIGALILIAAMLLDEEVPVEGEKAESPDPDVIRG